MERTSTPSTPRRVSVRHMLRSAVAAIVGGQRIEFTGRGSRRMNRLAQNRAAQIQWAKELRARGVTRNYGPVWTGMSRSSLRPVSGKITASY
jgi:hypothetical protein